MYAHGWIIAALAGLALPLGDATACEITDIQVKSAQWRAEGSYVHVVGELVNGCPEPVGIQIQITFRDAAGTVVNTDASTRNIPPGSYPFKTLADAVPGMKTMEVRVIDVKRWGDER